MSKFSRACLRTSPALLGALLLVGSPAEALEGDRDASETPNPSAVLESEADAMEQVNSISQLSDVQPTDWAFQALQNLVERYRCIAGYPDGTFRGNRAMTRYEFAAGLNACLDSITQAIGQPDTSNLATRDDLAVIQRLMEEFSTELATLRGRMDALEVRTAELEANQFSPMTKLSGSADFVLRDLFGGENVLAPSRANLAKNSSPLQFAPLENASAVFNYGLRLDFLTSFTGDDMLRVRLKASNARSLFLISKGERVTEPIEPLVSDEGFFDDEEEEGDDSIFEEEDFSSEDDDNDGILDDEDTVDNDPDGDQISDVEDTDDDNDGLADAVDGDDDDDGLADTADADDNNDGIPDASQSDEATETPQTPETQQNKQPRQQKRATEQKRDRDRQPIALSLLDYKFRLNKNLTINLFAAGGKHSLYADKITQSRSSPIYGIGGSGAGAGLTYKLNNDFKLNLGYIARKGNSPHPEAGFFNGNYSALAQLVYQPVPQFKLGLTYVNAYTPDRKFSVPSAGAYLGSLVRAKDGILSHSYGIEASYKVSPRFIVGGWFGYTAARLINQGDADIWNYAVTFSFPDLGKEGNLGILTVGADPTLKAVDVEGVAIPHEDAALYVDASYKYVVTDNISITTGVRWQPALYQNMDNDDVFLGTLKTTFSF